MKSVSFFSPGQPGLSLAVVCCMTVAGLANAFAEERTLSMMNIHTKEEITVTFKKDGKFIPEGLKKFNHVMRDWRKDQEITMDPNLIDLIWELHEELGSKQPVHLICGYRSNGTNEMLRRTVGGQARNSRHITGQAADLVFPDVPIKQLRYSALVRERGGVGFYPLSGIPFIHVDTGNVRHWPRISHVELAALYPNGHSKHIPSDGRPITKDDYRVAIAHLKSAHAELPWVVAGTKAAGTVMLASLTPSAPAPVLTTASLGGGSLPSKGPVAAATAKGGASLTAEDETEEGDEQNDDITFEPLPAAFLLTEDPLNFEDNPAPGDVPASVQKLSFLLSPPSVIAAEQFEQRPDVERVASAPSLVTPPAAQAAWRKARADPSRVASASVTASTE